MFTFKPRVSKLNKELGLKRHLDLNPNADVIPVEDRLIQEKARLAMKKETMKKIKEISDLQANQEKPFVRKSSVAIARAKSVQKREEEGIPASVTKHQELYMEYYKRNQKKDRKEDEIELQKNPSEYTFTPNIYRSPSIRSSSVGLAGRASVSSFTRRPSFKPELDQGRNRLSSAASGRLKRKISQKPAEPID